MGGTYGKYGGTTVVTKSSGCTEADLIIFLVVVFIIGIIVAFGTLSYREAMKQRRNGLGWFFLGCIFTFRAFIALKLSKNADEEGHDIKWWSFFGIVFGVKAIIAFEAGLNAENKLHDFDCWVIMSFLSFFGLFPLFISCFVKPFEHANVVSKPASNSNANITTVKQVASVKEGNWICGNCGKQNNSTSLFCSNCGSMKKI